MYYDASSENLESRETPYQTAFVADERFGTAYFPKPCIICSKFGDRYCKTCGIIYYCCDDHQETDWENIHKEICPSYLQLVSERDRTKILNSRSGTYDSFQDLPVPIKQSYEFVLGAMEKYILTKRYDRAEYLLKVMRYYFGFMANVPQKLKWEYVWAVCWILLAQYNFKELDERIEDAMRAFRGNHYELFKIRCIKALRFCADNKPDQVLRTIDEITKTARGDGSSTDYEKAIVLFIMGNYHELMKNDDKAENFYYRAVDIWNTHFLKIFEYIENTILTSKGFRIFDLECSLFENDDQNLLRLPFDDILNCQMIFETVDCKYCVRNRTMDLMSAFLHFFAIDTNGLADHKFEETELGDRLKAAYLTLSKFQLTDLLLKKNIDCE